VAVAHLGIGRRRFLDYTKLVTHTHTVGLLWTSDQLVAEAATYTTHNKHKRRTSIPSAGFELIIPAVERLQTYAFDRAATGISSLYVIRIKFNLPNVNSTRYVLEHKTV
jgi:hypothetical protein